MRKSGVRCRFCSVLEAARKGGGGGGEKVALEGWGFSVETAFLLPVTCVECSD